MAKPIIAALIVAAGRGTRAAATPAALPKQFVPLAGVPVIARALAPFLFHPQIARIAMVIHPDDRARLEDALGPELANVDIVDGGATRQQSVAAGLDALAHHRPDKVLIHDGARPFVSRALIDRVVDGLNSHAAILPALAVADTLKRCTDARVSETIARDNLFAAQTPQGFDFSVIHAAHARAVAEQQGDFTDDTSLVEWCGGSVHIVPGEKGNIKLTSREDMTDAEHMLRLRQAARFADIRVGHGFDVHSFRPGDHVMLCGVAIPHDQTLTGHSDADVGLHALTDAILGALSDGDIGHHFPPSDPQWKGASSDRFLAHAAGLVTSWGGMIAHMDVTLICEAPKIGPHRDAMRQKIADICAIPIARVSVKATTTEQLGFTGRREGIAAQATATIRLPVEPGDE